MLNVETETCILETEITVGNIVYTIFSPRETKIINQEKFALEVCISGIVVMN